MAWFDPTNNKPFDPAAFDYASEEQKLKQRQALANQLMQSKTPEAQMVSGHYVAPRGWQHLANALVQYLGMKSGEDNADAQKQLSDQSIQAMQYQLENAPKPTESYTPTNKPVEMGPPVPDEQINPSNVQRYSVVPNDIEVRNLDGSPLAGAIASRSKAQSDASDGPLASAIAASRAQATPLPPVADDTQPDAIGHSPAADRSPYGVSYETTKTVTPPTTGEQLAHLSRVARTGPMGQAIATQQINSLFGSKGEYQVVKGDDGQFMIYNNKTGQHQLLNGGNEKPIQTVDTPNGLVNVYKDNTSVAVRSRDGTPIVTKGQQEFKEKQLDKTNSLTKSIGEGEQHISDILEGTQLLNKVGTGRWQTPLNELSAYFTDSTDLDKLNRTFSQEKLDAAKRWLSGQGSVTDAERALVGASTFNPKGSTKANLDYANTVVKIMQRVLGEQRKQLGQAQGTLPTAPTAATGSVPARRQQVSESDLGGF